THGPVFSCGGSVGNFASHQVWLTSRCSTFRACRPYTGRPFRCATWAPLNAGYMDSPRGQATPFEFEAVWDCSSTFGLFVGIVARARMMMRVSGDLIR